MNLQRRMRGLLVARISRRCSHSEHIWNQYFPVRQRHNLFAGWSAGFRATDARSDDRHRVRKFAGRQQVDGRFRLTLGGGEWGVDGRHDQYNVQPTLEQVRETVEVATRILPAILGLRVAQVWSGLLDLTPDALPVIERLPAIDGLIVAAGFSGRGFCLGPITGQILADLAVFGTTELPIDAFQLSRFDGEGQDAAALALHG